MSYILSEVQRVSKKYGTRDPYELLDAIGAITRFSYEYSLDGLKGYCTIMNRTQYVVINGNLDDADMRVVAGHEAAHLIIHRAHIMSSPIKAMKDFNLYSNKGRIESEANFFLADFIVSDEDVLDTIRNDYDFFAAARDLCIPAPLYAFKLHSMMGRGYKVRNPVNLDSTFLGR